MRSADTPLERRSSLGIGRPILRWIVCATLLLASGCASLTRSATSDLAGHLSRAVLDHDDPATVQEAAPSFLLLVDALIAADPASTDLLIAGAKLYSHYASAFVSDADRARRLSQRARAYAERALCLESPRLCGMSGRPFDAFSESLGAVERSDVPVLYTLGVTWATWISLHSSDWSAVADLPKVESLLHRIVELDPTHDDGGAHLYLGVLETQRPSELGGKPEEGRAHFERALELSGQRNLMVKVLIARHYARLVFDRALHDRLLEEVIAADTQASGFTLLNTLAQHEARKLLGSADEYF